MVSLLNELYYKNRYQELWVNPLKIGRKQIVKTIILMLSQVVISLGLFAWHRIVIGPLRFAISTEKANVGCSKPAPHRSARLSPGDDSVGNLTYVDATGSERPLTAQSASVAVTLVNHQITSDDEVVDIVADWQAPTKQHHRGRGLFLDVYGDAVQDDYAGEIQWLLTDAPSTI